MVDFDVRCFEFLITMNVVPTARTPNPV